MNVQIKMEIEEKSPYVPRMETEFSTVNFHQTAAQMQRFPLAQDARGFLQAILAARKKTTEKSCQL